jgi:hypothetical protein
MKVSMNGYKAWSNFQEFLKGEVRRISILGTWVNKRKEDSGFEKPRRLLDSLGTVFWNRREGALR